MIKNMVMAIRKGNEWLQPIYKSEPSITMGSYMHHSHFTKFFTNPNHYANI